MVLCPIQRNPKLEISFTPVLWHRNEQPVIYQSDSHHYMTLKDNKIIRCGRCYEPISCLGCFALSIMCFIVPFSDGYSYRPRLENGLHPYEGEQVKTDKLTMYSIEMIPADPNFKLKLYSLPSSRKVQYLAGVVKEICKNPINAWSKEEQLASGGRFISHSVPQQQIIIEYGGGEARYLHNNRGRDACGGIYNHNRDIGYTGRMFDEMLQKAAKLRAAITPPHG